MFRCRDYLGIVDAKSIGVSIKKWKCKGKRGCKNGKGVRKKGKCDMGKNAKGKRKKKR